MCVGGGFVSKKFVGNLFFKGGRAPVFAHSRFQVF